MANQDGLVLVTGANGFIASHIIEQLLNAGYKVRGTVRSADPSRVKHLTDMNNSQNLELIECDLMKEDGWIDATKGVTYCMHTASPFFMDYKDAQKELVDPAVNGTLFVLKAAHANGVSAIVLTSSMAAITDQPIKDHIYTEADWNQKSTVERNPYYYSKKLAEEAAWDYVKENNNPFRLSVINPFMVIGPSHTSALNSSVQIIRDVMDGNFPAIMDVGWGLVDVRDVARAHVLAMENPKANGRYLTCNVALAMREVCAKLGEWYPGYKVPTVGLDCSVGSKVVKFAARFQNPGVRDYIKSNVGTQCKFDNSKVVGLGVEFRPIDETLQDTVTDLNKWGHIKTVPKQKKSSKSD